MLDGARPDGGGVDRDRATPGAGPRATPPRRGRPPGCCRRDPWDWRAVWLQGLAALRRRGRRARRRVQHRVRAAARGARAQAGARVACELTGDRDIAERMYTVCARSDATYVAPAEFGLARLRGGGRRRADALAALDRIPVTSRAFSDSRRLRAVRWPAPRPTPRPSSPRRSPASTAPGSTRLTRAAHRRDPRTGPGARRDRRPGLRHAAGAHGRPVRRAPGHAARRARGDLS